MAQFARIDSQIRANRLILTNRFSRARKKLININIFGGTVSGTNRNRPWDKWDPSPGQTGTPSQGQTGRFLLNSTVKSPFCPVCPWDGWGFVPGTIAPEALSEKCLCVFLFIGFFAPQFRVPELNPLFFCESCFGGLKIANRRFEAIHANRSHVMKIGAFLRIDSRESIRANLGKVEWGVFGGGGSCSNRFVLKSDVAIASAVSIFCKNSLAIADFFAKRTQLAKHCRKPPLPHSRFPRIARRFATQQHHP